MKYTKVVNPSSTPQTITVDVPDPVITATGETPIEPVPPVNHAPVVSLGGDITLTLPFNSVTLNGNATDPDTGGSVQAYIVEKIAGSGNIETPNSPKTKITDLLVGTSTFRLTAIDNEGANGSDEINVIVKEAVVTPPPPIGWKLAYSNYFDKDSDLDPFGTGQAGKSYIDKVNPITGAGSFRSRPANVSNGCRGEMQGFKTPPKGLMKWDTVYHYVLKSSAHSFQFHPQTSGGSASPGLWHVGGKFVWRNWIAGKNIDHPCNFTIPTEQKLSHQIEYSFGSNGYFKHWINDQLVCSWTGQVGDNSGQYGKIGVNANFDGNLAEAIKSDVSYDNFEIYVPV